MQPPARDFVYEIMEFEPYLDLTSSIILFGTFQAIFLACIFFKDGVKSPSLLLGMMMVALAAIEFESFLQCTGWIVRFPHWINISPPLVLLLGPLSFLYTQKLTGFSNRRLQWVHFTPAILFLLYSFFFYLQPASYKTFVVMKEAHPEIYVPMAAKIFPIDPLHIRGWIIIEGMALQLLCYVTVMLIKSFSQNRVQNHTWPKFLSVSLAIGSILFLLTGGVVNGNVIFEPILPAATVNIYCTVLVYSISGYWLYHITLPGLHRKKYAKAEVPAELRTQKLMRIKEIMETEKLYKASDFGLDALSRRMSISSHQLSQIINAGAGMSFLEFINQYRVNEARRILNDPELRNIKVEALAHELGYQSKSAFFCAFKRVTQTTPARYRDLGMS